MNFMSRNCAGAASGGGPLAGTPDAAKARPYNQTRNTPLSNTGVNSLSGLYRPLGGVQ